MPGNHGKPVNTTRATAVVVVALHDVDMVEREVGIAGYLVHGPSKKPAKMLQMLKSANSPTDEASFVETILGINIQLKAS